MEILYYGVITNRPKSKKSHTNRELL